MTTSLEQSVKERLRSIAQERKTTFANLWRTLILERFLVRLCKSDYKKHFVLKGGFLLARYLIIGRETKDLDFLVKKLSTTHKTLTNAVEEICKIDLNVRFKYGFFTTNKNKRSYCLYKSMAYFKLKPFYLSNIFYCYSKVKMELRSAKLK